MAKFEIDINCDMGESYGRFKIGDDENIFPFITSCNIACGFHGGDPVTIEKTIEFAIQNNVNIGAHPSYPDLSGFGRRKMDLKKDELKSLIKYQVSALKGLAESRGATLSYVKPHGALYNSMAGNELETKTVIEAIQEIDSSLYLMGLAGSLVEEIANQKKIYFVAEAFADRRYEKDGTLMSRQKEGSVIDDPKEAAEQVLSIVMHQKVKSLDGITIPLKAQSICIHGDNPAAVVILSTLNKRFEENNILKKSFIS
jgi:UPF0271 protein